MAQAPRRYTIADALGFGSTGKGYLAPSTFRRDLNRQTTTKEKRRADPIAAQVQKLFGMAPDVQRATFLPLAANQYTGNVELAWPGLLYELARSFVAPGVAASGQKIDAEKEASNFAMNFTGAGSAAGRLAPVQRGAVLGMSGAPRFIERRLADLNFDPETYDVKKYNMPSLLNTVAGYERTGVTDPGIIFPVENLVNRPFISTMYDRSAAGKLLTSINGKNLDIPVKYQGGQDFMFNNRAVTASAPPVIADILKAARRLKRETGQNPIFIPFRMKGTGSDFATMTGETMMSQANQFLGGSDKMMVNKIVGAFIPNFKGIDNPEGYIQFQKAKPDTRKEIQNMLDRFSRESGILSLPETRLILTDLKQIDKPNFGLQNVGIINADADMIMDVGHPTYAAGAEGQALGVLSDPVGLLEFLPQTVKTYGIDDPFNYVGQNMKWTPEQAAARGLKSTSANPGRALRSSINTGIITEDMVQKIIDRRNK